MANPSNSRQLCSAQTAEGRDRPTATASCKRTTGHRIMLVFRTVVLVFALSAAAPALAQSKILVVDPEAGTGNHGAVFEVDELGNREILSDFGSVRQGPRGTNPVALAVQPGGLILVVDPSAGTGKRGALFAVDPETGLRRIVSDFGKAAQGPVGGQHTGLVA